MAAGVGGESQTLHHIITRVRGPYMLPGFLPSSLALPTLPPLNSCSRTSLECCFDSSLVCGLLRLALERDVSDGNRSK